MKKLLITVLAIIVLAPVMAQAENIGFDLGVLSYNTREKTGENGTGNYMVVKVPVDSSSTLGFYNEGLGFNLTHNANGGAATIVPVDISISGIQVTRKIADKVNVGLNLGMADVTGTLALAGFVDNVPTADIFVQWSILSGGDKLKSDFTATLGYRSLMITPVDPDGAATDFTKEVNDLGGFYLGIAIGISF
ncbi:MAG: hypothetical protein V1709_10620 [Planctomycetota bacterium]